MERFWKLVEKLGSVGLATEVRHGDSHSLLVFVKVVSEQYMFGEVYRSRYVARIQSMHLRRLTYFPESMIGSTAYDLRLRTRRQRHP